MNKPDKMTWKQKLAASMEKIKKSSLWQTLAAWIKVHKEMTILGGMLLLLILITAATSGSAEEDAAETIKETVTIIGSGKTTVEEQLEGSSKEHQIKALVNRYFDAIAACDVETLNSICETTDGFDEEVLAEYASYIEKYQNLDCTIMDGLVEGTYVVYVYYEMKFYYIDTPAPALVQLYIKTDKDQMLYIYQGIIDGELSAYMAELTAGEQISQLADEVNQKLRNACAADEDLNTFIQVLKNQAQGSAEENSGEKETGQEENELPDTESMEETD